MGANRTGSQLRTSQGFNCLGSPWSEPFSKSAASLQTVILHRWGIKCWFRNVGLIIELSSLQNYHKPSSKMWRAGLLAQKCKLVQLALKSLDMLSAQFRQVNMPCLPTKPPPLLGAWSHLPPFSARQCCTNGNQSFSRIWEGGIQSHIILLHIHQFQEVKMALIRFQDKEETIISTRSLRKDKLRFKLKLKNIKLSLPPHEALL